MSRPNTTLVGSLLPNGTGNDLFEGGIDTTQVIDQLLASLHAGSRADLTFWTEGDLIQWMDEGLKRLARTTSVFVTRDSSILTVAQQAAYNLPQRHISTLHVSHTYLDSDGASHTLPLRPAGSLELEMLDEGYRTNGGVPLYWYEDLQNSDTFSLVSIPVASDEPLPIIYQGFPETLDSGHQNTLVPGPPVLKSYLGMYVLWQAYSREGEMESIDIAGHCKARVEMFDQIFTEYYGRAM